MAEDEKLINGYGDTYCECGTQFSQIKSIQNHIMECQKFQDRFGGLVKELIDVFKNTKTRNDYNIVKFLFHIMRQYIRDKLSTSRAIPEFNPNPSAAISNPISKNKQTHEVKLELTQPLQPLPELLSFMQPVVNEQMFSEKSNLVSCLQCTRLFPDEKNTISLSCSHRYCLECVKHKAFREYPDNGQILCNCKQPLTESEIQVNSVLFIDRNWY